KEKSGLEIINEIIADYQKKQKTPEFKFTEIMAKSTPKQREILQKAFGLEGSTDVNFSDTLKGVMGLLTSLDLNQKDKFLTYQKELRTKQGLNA
ncbi:hypothetical protein IT411_02280, partial [Candidatus Peregrinibacteria bacterium]|nr:hypothetical protein [Candidatus Peregrinibacteria bacterium]